MALARNSLLNLLPTLIGVAVSIVTVPFYISVVGNERYGALLLALILLGYFGQVDFGLGRAITQRLSSMPNASAEDRAGVVWSALAGAGVISVIGGAVVYAVALVFFRSFFEAGPGLRAEVLSSVWLFALCVPVIMLTGVSSGALTGLERFGVVSAGTTIGNVLSQVLPLAVAMVYAADFTWLLAASLAGRVIGLVPIVVSMAAVFLHRQKIAPSLAQLRRLFSYGSWIMVTAIVGPLMTLADRVVIGAVLGAAAVVAYSVPVQIASRTVMFPLALVQALFPRLAARDEEESSRLGKASVVLVGQLYGFVVIGLICLAEPLLRLWLGEGLDERSILVGQITAIGFWLNALANVPYALIQARGNSRYTAVLHTLELPLYAAMLYGFGATLGLHGVALAFTVRVAVDCGVLFHKSGFADRAVLSRLAAPAILIAVAMAASSWMQGWLSGMIGASVLCGVLAIFVWFQMPDQARAWLNQRLGR
ncbi:MAG: oligosaccharide flippase family protein [Porphyrobacter sp.]|nr:oligosaccharide flippase family protein [Porphyrobacter sp.]